MYIRLSKEDDKKGESESITNQRSLISEFCKKQNLNIFEEYIDDGISGTTFNRPGFNQMILDIKDNKINMVITKDLSRLGRDYINTGHYIEKYFPENKIRYISLLDGIDTGVDSNLNDITPFKSVLNDMYAKDISNKIKSVKHNKQQLGLFIGSKAPYGYVLDKNNPNKLFIDNDAKIIVERIFKEACLGHSCNLIAKKLNIDKIPSPSYYALLKGYKMRNIANCWYDSRIREIISNEVYIGNMVQRRMKKINYKSKKNIRLPKDQWQIVKNTHQPIVDIDTFNKANSMINSRKKTRNKSYNYLLKGFVYCHECKKKLTCTSRNLSNGTVYYFRCNNYTKSKTCSPHCIRVDLVENIVINDIQKILSKNISTKIIQKATNKSINDIKCNNLYITKLQQYTVELNKLSIHIDKLYDDKLNNLITNDDFSRIYNSLKQKQIDIQNNINNINILKEYKFNEEIIFNNILNKFNSANFLNRSILDELIEKIEIDKNKKIYIYFKFNNNLD